MRIICFDTETTGLPENRNTSIYETLKWPHIVQLSFMVYDVEKKEIVEEYDEVIKIDEGVVLTPKSVEIHGISRDVISERGVPISNALLAFKRALNSCERCVGHNISFDKRLLIVEAIRNKGFDSSDNSYVQFQFKNEFCTMLKSVEICKIEKLRGDGTIYFKYPTLIELHYHLFKKTPKNAHNSKVDVLICLRCYCKFVHNQDLSCESRQFRRMYRECCN
jgi:DNA polymerase III epsilon subunit-like protein